MKKILITTCAFLLITPGLCAADYLVVFKNGGRLKATDITMKGSVLYLEALGGTIGIPKDNIQYIQEIAPSKPKPKPAPDKEVAQEEKGEDEEDKVVAENEEQPPEQEPVQEEDPTEKQKERKAYLIKKLKRHYRLYAKEITKSNKLKIKKRIADLRERQRQAKELEEEVRKTNGGALPAWWTAMPLPEPPAGL